MNPLDNLELICFIENIKKNMPLITDRTINVKRSFSQGMPKNLSDYAVKIDNEFLNSNLAIIEEINHRDSKHWIPKWFKEYQNNYFGKDDILNKDNFFKATLHDTWKECYDKAISFPKVSGGSIFSQSMLSFSTPLLSRFGFGLVLETATGTHAGNYTINSLSGNKVTIGTGIISTKYDRLAHRLVSAAGNINLGAYSDDGGSPSKPLNREATTGSITSTADYALKSVTEFTTATAQQWIATIHDAVQSTYYDAAGGANTTYDIAQTFGALPDPFTAATLGSTPLQLKMEHS